MFLLNWYREYLEIKNTRAIQQRELQYCEACETLKLQLAVANEERKFLIQKLTAEPVTETRLVEPQVLKPILPNRIGWNTRRQMLESEDRERAKILKKNQDELKTDSKNDSKILTINEIEKELGVENG